MSPSTGANAPRTGFSGSEQTGGARLGPKAPELALHIAAVERGGELGDEVALVVRVPHAQQGAQGPPPLQAGPRNGLRGRGGAGGHAVIPLFEVEVSACPPA